MMTFKTRYTDWKRETDIGIFVGDSMDLQKNKDILVVIDGSYFMYYVLFGAVNRFHDKYRMEYDSIVKPEDETDQESLPSLLVSNSFKKELKLLLMKRCEFIDFILRKNFQKEFDEADHCTFIFALDDYVKNSFRKEKYPEYKATRKLAKKSYSTSDIHRYIVKVLFPELDLQGRFGYHLLHVEGAEGDDVIACVMKNFNDYGLKILIASDHDFCQLENVSQIDLRGNVVKPTVKLKGKSQEIDPKTALLMKIIVGDGSDNIPSIGEKIGPVKAYKYASDKESLKKFLIENSSSAKKFLMNKELIDFNYIPKELSDKIVKEASIIFEEDRRIQRNNSMDLSLQNLMEL